MTVAIPSTCNLHETCLALNSDRLIAAISSHGTMSLFGRGAEIFSHGESLGRLGLVQSGSVKVSSMSADGVEHVLHLLRPGDFVGDLSTMPTNVSWSAATDVDLCWLTSAMWLEACRECPEIQVEVMSTLLLQMQQHYLFRHALRERNALQRIAYWLMMEISSSCSTGGFIQIRNLLSRRDLASLLDMTVETLCRVLRQLDAIGAIELKSSNLVILRNTKGLRETAKLDEEHLLADPRERVRVAMAMAPGKPESYRATARGSRLRKRFAAVD